MIRAIIIDDEQHCIDRLSGLVENHFSENIHVMDCFSTVPDGIKAIRKYKPDLVFLDVQIGEQTSFELLQQLDRIDFDIIFTTAFEKYAVQAFKFSALDYLLKPVDIDDLQQAISKLMLKKPGPEMGSKMETLLGNLTNASKRICVPVVNGLVVIRVEDIIRCQSEINYTTIFMKDKQKLTVARVLKEFEEMLSDYLFFRVHNSHLVNLMYVKAYSKSRGSVTLNDGTEIEVSTRRKDDLVKKLAAM